MFVKPDTVTPVVRLQLFLAYWQDIYFGQLTEMALIFSVFTNLIWTMTKIRPKKKTKKKTAVKTWKRLANCRNEDKTKALRSF